MMKTKHLHISYNKKGLDLEAIGLKRLDVDMWDVYFQKSTLLVAKYSP